MAKQIGNKGFQVIDPLIMALLFAGLIGIEGFAKSSAYKGWRLRSWEGTAMLLGAGVLMMATCALLTGAWLPSLILTLTLAAILTLGSNIKRQVLGEPLVFTDLALLGAVVRHPHFYLSALKPWQLIALPLILFTLLGVLALFSTSDVSLRVSSIWLAVASAVLLAALTRLSRWRGVSAAPDLDHDVQEHGLIATLVVYWCLWRQADQVEAGMVPPLRSAANELVVIIQCESFADPAAIFPDHGEDLPGLTRARDISWQSGRLMVSGFGAYTMRTEFGVLFGIPEEALGVRRFDPFLTADSMTTWALPHRLDRAEWSTIFVHPHDMRFYGRDRLMPASGFDTIVGEDAFDPPVESDGRYVTDAALCDKLLELAQTREGPALIYAVSIENHGPWAADSSESAEGNKAGYMRLLKRSDAMLERLIETLPKLGRPVVLCFFGDHRPSIPLVSTPGGERHTPYVVIRFREDGSPITRPHSPRDLSPAELQTAILEAIGSRGG